MCWNCLNTVINTSSIVPSKMLNQIINNSSRLMFDCCYCSLFGNQYSARCLCCSKAVVVRSYGKLISRLEGCRWLKLVSHLFSVHRLPVSKVFKNTTADLKSVYRHVCALKNKSYEYIYKPIGVLQGVTFSPWTEVTSYNHIYDTSWD